MKKNKTKQKIRKYIITFVEGTWVVGEKLKYYSNRNIILYYSTTVAVAAVIIAIGTNKIKHQARLIIILLR